MVLTPAEPPPARQKTGLVDEPREDTRKVGRIAGLEEQAIAAVVDQLGDATDPGCHDRNPARNASWITVRAVLRPNRRHDEDVHIDSDCGDAVVRNGPRTRTSGPSDSGSMLARVASSP